MIMLVCVYKAVKKKTTFFELKSKSRPLKIELNNRSQKLNSLGKALSVGQYHLYL